MPLPNRGVAPGTHSETGASEPGGYLYEIRSNPSGLSRNDFHADAPLAARLFAVNVESRMSCVLGCVDALRRTLIGASTCAKAL